MIKADRPRWTIFCIAATGAKAAAAGLVSALLFRSAKMGVRIQLVHRQNFIATIARSRQALESAPYALFAGGLFSTATVTGAGRADLQLMLRRAAFGQHDYSRPMPLIRYSQ